MLQARIDDVSWVDAKLRLCELSSGRGLTELEEGWLVRSLYREDRLSQADIARMMSRHKSWVWRRLMLVESLDPELQAEVRLGLIAARTAVAVSRLPRGNQQAASAVVLRRGLTVRQTELLVDEVLTEQDATVRATLLARRLETPSPLKGSGPRCRCPQSPRCSGAPLGTAWRDAPRHVYARSIGAVARRARAAFAGATCAR
jgi:hypothetical protein